MSDIRLSVFTVAAPDLSPAELASAAKQAGIAGIEWRYQDIPAGREQEAPSFWGNNRCSIPTGWSEAQLAAFRDAAASGGVRSLAVVPYLKCGDIAGTRRVLEAAKQLGASFIRLGVHRYDRSRPYRELFDEQRRYLQEAASLCAEYGVKGLIELHHGTISASASAASRLLEGFDPAALGALYDPGNLVHEGYENYRMGMEILGPYLAHVHMKNAGWTSTADDAGGMRWQAGWVGIDKGVVDWAQVVADLRAVGYSGWIGVEDFSGEFGTVEMLNHYAAYMNRLLGN